MSRINVFLVDDHDIVRQGLRLLINSEPDMHVVGESAHGSGLCEPVRSASAHVVVMDVSMPDMNGAAATVELRRGVPDAKIVALTRHTEKAYVQEMVRAGASGYILKQNGAATLIAAIRAVMRGGTYLDPAVIGEFVEELAKNPAGAHHLATQLTGREQQIATMVAYGHSNKEIAAELAIAVKTVETHKSNIMSKLELTSRAELVQFALEHGWLDRSHM